MFSEERRLFLKHSALIGAALSARPMSRALAKDAPSKTTPPSEKLRVAVVGVNGRGMSHVGGFAGRNGCEIVAVCDCDEGVIGNAMKAIEKKQGKAPRFEQDIRKLLEDKSIDIVSIATPEPLARAGRDLGLAGR